MDSEKKKYKVLKPVAIDGVVQPGAIVELTEEQAANIGIGEYLELYVEAAPTPPAPPAGDTSGGEGGEGGEDGDQTPAKAKYKALESFELEGQTYEPDAEVELTDEQAAALEGKVEKVEAAAE